MPLPFICLAHWDSEDQVHIVIWHNLWLQQNIKDMWLLNGVFWNWRIHHFVSYFYISTTLSKAPVHVQHMTCLDCDLLFSHLMLCWSLVSLLHSKTYGPAPFCVHTDNPKNIRITSFKVKPVYEITLKDLVASMAYENMKKETPETFFYLRVTSGSL